MSTNTTTELPAYSDLFQPVLDALKALGGSAKPSEVRDWLVADMNIPDESLELTIKNGTQVFLNRVQWARLYLSKTGYIGSSKRGVWALTEKGRDAKIDAEETREITATVSKLNASKRQRAENDDDTDDSTDTVDHRSRVLEILYSISPGAFERLCQRLLRESGFEQVLVTGRSGDGGIDGNGVLQINPFVSFRVLFQCKRYRGTVGSPAIRDFRGAMMGRADKGIILTTGTFSPDAQREAVRDGVPPIELVDGNNLVDLFESLEFGLIPKQAYDVDESFFLQFDA